MQYIIVFHIIGFILWLGGLFAFNYLMTFATEKEAPLEISTSMSAILYRFVLTGALITAITGLYQLFFNGLGLYLSQGWFHGKLFFILVLIASSIYAFVVYYKTVNGNTVKRSSKLILHILSGVSLFLYLIFC